MFGFFTKPLINCLLPHQARDNRHKSGLNSPKEDLALPLLNFEESATSNLDRAKTSLSLLLERPVRTIHFYWRKFDDSYMRPIFGGPRWSDTLYATSEILLGRLVTGRTSILNIKMCKLHAWIWIYMTVMRREFQILTCNYTRTWC